MTASIETKRLKAFDMNRSKSDLYKDMEEFERRFSVLLDFKALDDLQQTIYRTAYEDAIRTFVGEDWGKYTEIEVRIKRKVRINSETP
ncbi:hypothetical protein [Paenibacillus sp. DMB20]|uniref:hypothetical protein n=1 Tax=Paenibacillus sp. DMB20 TaxID=1642570 RepID=UPI0006279316|nr:hypothetical protein [Paenibacillus sp. DMB20]KKO51139.1 hypothetical protein XI25_29575 [Paenibacillus sp. DMB20]